MKIGIYSEPFGGSLGGSDYLVAILAEALAPHYQVEIVHHWPALTVDRLAEVFGTNLSAVNLRYVTHEKYSYDGSHNPWRRYQKARAWLASLSEPYDLFINSTHGMPPFCHAPRGMLIVLFPTLSHPIIQYRREEEPWADGSFYENYFRRLYREWEWKKRFDSYQVKLTISQYTRTWTKRWWGVESHVLYPPVDIRFDVAKKTNMILSVGRFATTGHTKKQLEMVTAFRQMKELSAQGWEFLCTGSLADSAQNRAYFETVRHIGAACRAQVLANLKRADLTRLFEQAKIFWHAAGYGEDDNIHPGYAEHFGIATVEAMAAGCVPVVINKGGQREIVQHGVNGFLWNTLEELREYTTLLAHDEQLWAQMSEAARIRAQFFSREEYTSHFLKHLQPLLPSESVKESINDHVKATEQTFVLKL